jgi:hypothetical protein
VEGTWALEVQSGPTTTTTRVRLVPFILLRNTVWKWKWYSWYVKILIVCELKTKKG